MEHYKVEDKELQEAVAATCNHIKTCNALLQSVTDDSAMANC